MYDSTTLTMPTNTNTMATTITLNRVTLFHSEEEKENIITVILTVHFESLNASFVGPFGYPSAVHQFVRMSISF